MPDVEPHTVVWYSDTQTWECSCGRLNTTSDSVACGHYSLRHGMDYTT